MFWADANIYPKIQYAFPRILYFYLYTTICVPGSLSGLFKEPSYKSENMPCDWDKCIEEGNKSFEYMVHNYDKMFDKSVIKHFNIHYTTRGMMSYYRIIRSNYREKIQPSLIEWINEESYTLFEYSNWKPQRDAYEYSAMYMGYNKLFKYKHYYFQLGLHYYCDECEYCNIETNRVHFELYLYGWDKRDPDIDNIQPIDHDVVISNLIIPDTFWDTD